MSNLEVYFEVQAPLKFGEEIRVVGNFPCLGSDDANLGVRLVTSPSEYPHWKSTKGLKLIKILFLFLKPHCLLLIFVFDNSCFTSN